MLTVTVTDLRAWTFGYPVTGSWRLVRVLVQRVRRDSAASGGAQAESSS